MDFDWESIKNFMVGFFPQAKMVIDYVVYGLGWLVVSGAAYVKITPNQEDDAWWAKMESVPVLGGFMRFVMRFSPIQRKE